MFFILSGGVNLIKPCRQLSNVLIISLFSFPTQCRERMDAAGDMTKKGSFFNENIALIGLPGLNLWSEGGGNVVF